jgi:nucleotide-binding universal stress UspA family protein
VKERKGPFGLVVGGIVDSVVQTARRRTQDREPRAIVYDADGRPRLLGPDDPARDDVVDTAAKLIDLAGAPPPETEPEPGDDPEDELAP